jgi:predicted amidohydrolase
MCFSRGEELRVFNTELGKLGIVVYNDSWYPEVNRILALQDAEIICHPGALPEEHNSCRQLAGMQGPSFLHRKKQEAMCRTLREAIPPPISGMISGREMYLLPVKKRKW